jgi:ABC-type uncharacterized transport system involved in gliding motility auxiliary subunit
MTFLPQPLMEEELEMSDVHKSLKKTLRKRSTKFGVNALTMILIVLGILILINFLGTRHHRRLDTTAGNRFSLSDHTIKVLRGIDQDVVITAFTQGEDTGLRDLLSEYAYASRRVSFRFIDPDSEPGMAKAYEINRYGTIVVESGEKVEKIDTPQEEDLTNAILSVTRKGKKVICVLSGHGEKDIDSDDPNGYSSVRQALEDENYDVRRLILATEGEIPPDCSVLLLAGPQKVPLEGELEAVKHYLNGSGKLMVLLEPHPATGLADFLSAYGLQVGHDLVLDASGMGRLFGMGPAVPLVSQYESHAITEEFNIMTFFPTVRSVTPTPTPPSELTVQPLAKTSPHSWGETELGTETAQLDPDQDLQGPVTISVAVEAKPEEMASGASADSAAAEQRTRLVVFGDSDFASNAYFASSGNGDLFLNAINWLAQEEDLISIRPKDLEDRRVTLTPRQSRMIFFVSVILMPLAALIMGAVVWIRRR